MTKLLFFAILGFACLFSFTNNTVIKTSYRSNRLLDFNWPEPDFNIRKFPHEKYCSYYYNRESEDFFTIRKCPKGESFDYHVHECKVKEVSKCWSQRYGKHEIHSHIHSKWRKNFKCPFAEGKFPDIYDCSKFIVCNNGIPAHKHCTPDKLFDKDERHCVNQVDAICASITDGDDIEHNCPSSTGNFGHPHDCSKFYECHLNEPKLKSCGKDTLFDEVYRDCMAKEQVFCGYRYDPHQEDKSSKVMMKKDVSSTTTMDPIKAQSPTIKIKTENSASTGKSIFQSSTISPENPSETTRDNIVQSSTNPSESSSSTTPRDNIHSSTMSSENPSSTKDSVILSSTIPSGISISTTRNKVT